MTAAPRESTRLAIRPATLEDLPAITDIYNDAIRSTTATFDTEPKSLEEQKRWFAAHDGRHPVLVAELAGKVVGWAALSRWSDRCAYDGTAESSLYVAPDYRGRGVGRRLKKELILSARQAGLHTILARVAEGSDASLHLNREFGFRQVGVIREVGFKFGRRLDVHLLQLLLADATVGDVSEGDTLPST